MDYQAKTNWNYNDTVTEQDMNRIEAGLGDLHQRLDTPATLALVLQPGIQTIQAERDTPFNLTGISGRMLLNLTGREGSFEQLPKFFFSTTGSLDTTNKVSGTNGLKLTINNNEIGYAGLSIYNPKLGTNGAKYLIRGAIKNGNLSGDGAYLQITDTVSYAENSPLIKTTDRFVNCFALYDGTKSKHNMISAYMAVKGQSGQYAYFDEVAVYEISNTEYTRLSSLSADEVAAQYPYTEGLAGVKNPYAIRWTSTEKTDVASMLAFDTELLASPVPTSDAERDRLEQGVDGQYYKTTQWRKLTLGGDLSWTFRTSNNGIKRVEVTGLGQSINTIPQGNMIKFDGALLSNDLGAIANWTTGDMWQLGDPTYSNLIVSIAAADSGWGDNYTPTPDEIKAYFHGWVMYDGSLSNGAASPNSPANNYYNGTGTKAWCYRIDGVSRSYTGPTSIVPITKAPNFRSYEIVYSRGFVQSEPVFSEGSLQFTQGTNVIEIGSGLVLREKSNVWRGVPGSESSVINNIDRQSSWLQNKARRIVQIYKNSTTDKRWSISTDSFAYGLARAYMPSSIGLISDSDLYSTTYVMLDQYPIAPFSINLPNNENAIFNDLIRNLKQTQRRVSIVEMTKAEKNPNSASWIFPTLLNGWTALAGYRTGYRKIGNSNIVQLNAIVANGITDVGTVLFYLPPGYRPSASFVFAANSRNNSGNYNSITLDVRASGAVLVSFGTPYTGALTFQVTFEAEQ